MGERDDEVRHLRELLNRVVTTARILLRELEALEKVPDDAQRGAAVTALLARRIPELRLVTDRTSGESDPRRGGASPKDKPGSGQ